MKISRRHFLINSGAVIGGFLNPGAGFSLSSSSISREEIQVKLRNLPPAFEGFRIGFMSDFHLGIWLAQAALEESLSKMADAKPDILLLGGDYIGIPDSMPGRYLPYSLNDEFSNISPAELPRAILLRLATSLKKIEPSYGTFAVYGNHDLWHGPHICAKIFAENGINFLVNEEILISRSGQKLSIYGFDDYWTGIPRPPSKSELCRVAMSHNPDWISQLIRRDSAHFDLALCGHTHGGQIKLPGVGALTYNIEDSRFGAGLASEGGKQVYTTRGLGVVELPFRLNCPPEITVITLTR